VEEPENETQGLAVNNEFESITHLGAWLLSALKVNSAEFGRHWATHVAVQDDVFKFLHTG
jgi:hypothetical protein